MYILFTSAIPAIAFGEQFVRNTGILCHVCSCTLLGDVTQALLCADGQVSAVQVLTATAACGVIQARPLHMT